MSVDVRQVLFANQTISDVVRLIGGTHHLVLANHAGGDWQTEYRPKAEEDSNDDVWIDIDIDFSGNGIQRFESVENGDYRIKGGSVGARAWIIPVVGGRSPIKIADGV